jgi:hypothetical protein
MSKKSKKTTKKIKIQEGIDHPIRFDDKSKRFSRDMKYLIFFTIWFLGFFIIMYFIWNK